MNARKIIIQRKLILSRFCIPKKWPEYTSWEFTKLVSAYYLKPKYPPSNGLAEKTVQTIKKTLKNTFIGYKTDPGIGILE